MEPLSEWLLEETDKLLTDTGFTIGTLLTDTLFGEIDLLLFSEATDKLLRDTDRLLAETERLLGAATT